jgi:type IV pilus assembly protein PilB
VRLKLGEILVQAGAIDDAQLLAALGEQKSWGHRLGVTLVKMGFVTEEQLVNGLANQLGLPIARLEGKRIRPDVLGLIPLEFADRHMCLPLFLKHDGGAETLFIGMDDPCNLEVLDDLSFRTGLKVKPVLVSSSELCQGIDYFYRGTSFGAKEVKSVPIREEIALAEIAEGEIELVEGALELLPEYEHPAPVAIQSQADSEAYGAATRKILHVLTQLLIDAGVIDREQLAKGISAALSDD